MMLDSLYEALAEIEAKYARIAKRQEEKAEFCKRSLREEKARYYSDKARYLSGFRDGVVRCLDIVGAWRERNG